MSKPTLSRFLRYADLKRQDEQRREARRYAAQAWLRGIVEAIPVTGRNPNKPEDDKPLAYNHRPFTTNYLVSQRDQVGAKPKSKGTK